MEKIQKTIKTKKFKHACYIVLVSLFVGWGAFRFAAVASENARYVFNASRVAADQGMPIESVVVSNTAGVLYEPLHVKNNRAYVTGNRAAKLSAGQKIGTGKITYVSKSIDINTGLFVVRTAGVSDGLHYAEFTADGYFVPLYAVSDGVVFVAQDGHAVARDVNVVRQDSKNAYITSGLNDGDIVILSKVKSGDKVKVVK